MFHFMLFFIFVFLPWVASFHTLLFFIKSKIVTAVIRTRVPGVRVKRLNVMLLHVLSLGYSTSYLCLFNVLSLTTERLIYDYSTSYLWATQSLVSDYAKSYLWATQSLISDYAKYYLWATQSLISELINVSSRITQRLNHDYTTSYLWGTQRPTSELLNVLSYLWATQRPCSELFNILSLGF